MAVVGICGLIGHGKGTVGDVLLEQGYQRLSFADKLKDAVAVMFDWDRDTVLEVPVRNTSITHLRHVPGNRCPGGHRPRGYVVCPRHTDAGSCGRRGRGHCRAGG
mgnify:CR=1 FL=1